MNSLPQNLGKLARAVGLVLAGPTKALLVLTTGLVAVVAVLAAVLVLRPDAPGPVGTAIAIAVPVLLAVPVLVLAIRRRRWLAATADLDTEHHTITGTTSPHTAQGTGQELIPADLTERIEQDMHGREGADDVQAVFDAMNEGRAPGSEQGAGGRMTRALSRGRLGPIGRALSKLERAQRALLTAAGGPVAAPYLRDDLRVSVAAMAGTLLVLPLAALAAIILALVLLTQ